MSANITWFYLLETGLIYLGVNSWTTVWSKIIDKIYPGKTDALDAALISAIIITIFVFMTIILLKYVRDIWDKNYQKNIEPIIKNSKILNKASSINNEQ